MGDDRMFMGEYLRAADEEGDSSAWARNCEEARLWWFGLEGYLARL